MFPAADLYKTAMLKSIIIGKREIAIFEFILQAKFVRKNLYRP